MSGYDPAEELCLDCGLPRSAHADQRDVEFDVAEVVEDEARVQFKQAVAVRVEEKLAVHRLVAALVAYKMAQAHGDASVPMPRDPNGDLDRLEAARIRKEVEARDFDSRVRRHTQRLKAERGDAEWIVPPGSSPSPSDRLAWLNGPGAK